MQFTLGSTSQIKTKAVAAACIALGLTASIKTMAVASKVSTQPVGQEETARGARNRAHGAQDHTKGSYGIGIENGIRWNGNVWEDFAVVIVCAPNGTEVLCESATIILPTDAVEVARARGFSTTTVGQVLTEWHGSDPNDPHTLLTNGTHSRLSLLTDTLINALNQSH
jgi:non-canonical (house-cleaning) NTP pyrophosphatase